MPVVTDPVLSNVSFLDAIPERSWGVPETAALAAATQLDISGAAPNAMVGLVQPTTPRKLTITVTDGDVSISAFQIDAVGTGQNGEAVTEQFVFAGGLVQTGTKLFKTITSITRTSSTGHGAGDTLDASWAAETPKLIPFLDGDYGVALDDPLREQEHILGDPEAQIMVHSRRGLAGPLKVGLWPHLWRTLLDYATVRDSTTRQLASRTFRYTVPTLETMRHFGCRVDKFTIEGASEGDVTMSMDLIGWYEDNNGASILSYPNSYVVPAVASLQFKSCAFVISLDAGTSFANRIKPLGVNSFSLNYENNLRPGPPVEDRGTVAKDGAISFLATGRKKLSLRYSAVFDRDTYGTMQRERLRTQFKMLGAHPNYTQVLTTSDPEVAGSNVSIAVTTDPTTGSLWNVGDVIYLSDGGTNLAQVASLLARATGPNTINADLDQNLAAGAKVYNAAIELKTAAALVGSMPRTKAFGDYINVEVNGEVFSGGDEPLTYKCRDMALPS